MFPFWILPVGKSGGGTFSEKERRRNVYTRYLDSFPHSKDPKVYISNQCKALREVVGDFEAYLSIEGNWANLLVNVDDPLFSSITVDFFVKYYSEVLNWRTFKWVPSKKALLLRVFVKGETLYDNYINKAEKIIF